MIASHRGEIEDTLFVLISSAEEISTRLVQSIYSAGLQAVSGHDPCRRCVFVDSYVNGVIHENPPKRTLAG